MSGMQYMITGAVLILLSTAGFFITEAVLVKKKKQIREETYQIYY